MSSKYDGIKRNACAPVTIHSPNGFFATQMDRYFAGHLFQTG